MAVTRLIIMDTVSGLAEKSEEFSNFWQFHENTAFPAFMYFIQYILAGKANVISKRIQKLMNSCAGFVLNKYVKESDLISLKWLPFEERVVFSSSKFAFKLLYDASKQNYPSLQFKKPKKELCSNHDNQFTIEAGTHNKDFDTIMSNNFNELPLHIHQITERIC